MSNQGDKHWRYKALDGNWTTTTEASAKRMLSLGCKVFCGEWRPDEKARGMGEDVRVKTPTRRQKEAA